MPRPEESETALRRAYHEMFVKFRDQLIEQQRLDVSRWVPPEEIDQLAWRQAEDAMNRMINMRRHNDVRRKKRRDEAA